MWRLFLRCLAAVLVAGACWLPAASAQPPLNPQARTVDEEEGPSTPALSYTVAVLVTILVMVILLTPSRKTLSK